MFDERKGKTETNSYCNGRTKVGYLILSSKLENQATTHCHTVFFLRSFYWNMECFLFVKPKKLSIIKWSSTPINFFFLILHQPFFIPFLNIIFDFLIAEPSMSGKQILILMTDFSFFKIIPTYLRQHTYPLSSTHKELWLIQTEWLKFKTHKNRIEKKNKDDQN